MQKQSYEDLVKRLDAVINILLETARPEGKKIPAIKSIEILSRAGLRPVEISEILGLSTNYVNVALTSIRRRKKTK
jgi:hypothetical protein